MVANREPPRRPLLGGGENLKIESRRVAGGRDKFHPTSIDEAYQVLLPQAGALAKQAREIPDSLSGDHLVFEAMVHPNYIANGYFPASVFASADVYVVGTRRASAPYKTAKREKLNSPTKSFLLAGARDGIAKLATLMAQQPSAQMLDWDEARQLREIGFTPPSRVARRIPDSLGEGEVITWEAVLSPIGRTPDDAQKWGAAAFAKFVTLVRRVGGDVDVEYRRVIDGLTFVPVMLDSQGVSQAAQFNLLRAIRPMPKVRPVRPLRRSGGGTMPPAPPVTVKSASPLRVAIFDGGLDPTLSHFAPYVAMHDLTSEAPTDDDRAHGAMVTSAFLYGHIDGGGPLPQPIASVDHYRVFPLPASGSMDHSLTWLLDQITDVVCEGKHRFVNLSLGPNEAVDEDDEPHQWTVTLDKLAKEYGVTFHCAVGNNGEDDAPTGMNRVLVPGDMVNGIGVGACDSADQARLLTRAPYSAVGPGRYGLRTQPLGVAFGGLAHGTRPFIGIDHHGQLAMDAGTSYACPFAMRGSVELAASLPGQNPSAQTVRAFVAHHANPRTRGHKIAELGLGRIRHSYADIWNCAENACCVLYQDQLLRGQVVAMRLPFPQGIPDQTPIELVWTLTYLSDTDPRDAFEYTTSGLEVTFRPNEHRVSVKDVKAKKSLGVFDIERDADRLRELSKQKVIELSDVPEAGTWKRHRGETQQRDEGKWETVIRGRALAKAGELFQPRLDINYLRRESGRLVSGDDVPPLGLAILVTMRAPADVKLYDRVRIEYPVLAPLVVVPLGAN